MNEKIKCEKCGAEMNVYHENNTCGMLCPKCGWGWVTTYSLPIETDTTIYTLNFDKPEKVTAAMIKLYANLTNLNFIQSKKDLESGNAKFSAVAAEIQKCLAAIHAAGLQFAITPDYPYNISPKQ